MENRRKKMTECTVICGCGGYVNSAQCIGIHAVGKAQDLITDIKCAITKYENSLQSLGNKGEIK